MSRIKLDKEKILKKFKTLSMTALCIQKTSKYMYQFSKSSDVIVSIWYQALCSAPEQSKVSLFYIANEMLQSRNYGSSNFKQSWKSQLPLALDLIKNSSTIDKIIRMFNIWIERHVYDQSFVEDLVNKLSSARSPILNEEDKKNIILSFEPDDAIEKLRNLIRLEDDANESIQRIDINSSNFDEKFGRDTIKKLKDKIQCNEFGDKLDESIDQISEACSLLEQELQARQGALKDLEHAEFYYQTQLNETLIVEDAYKRYGSLISKTKDALEEHLDFLVDEICPVDIDDAPSPGKTPPYLYDETSKHTSDLRGSPMSFQDVVSPAQSMDMSEDDTPIDANSSSMVSGALSLADRPYSPGNDIEMRIETSSSNGIADDSMSKMNSKSISNSSLSCSDALKILTSVFTQSLTKKTQVESEIRVNLQPDIFRNTLSTANNNMNNNNINNNGINNIDNSNDSIDSSSSINQNSSKTETSDSVVADAFRLISNLTGIKNISERNISNDSEKLKSNLFPYNQPSYPSVNSSSKCDTAVPHPIFPEVQNSFSTLFGQHTINSNPIFPLLGSATGIPTQPPPPIFNPLSNNPLAYNMAVINKDNNQSNKKSPGSCTEDEDEGGATPTQDEPVIHPNPPTLFNPNVLPVLHPSVEEFNKQIQNAMNASTNPFGMPNILSGSNDTSPNNSIQPPPWNLANQYSFNMKNSSVPPMNMPFNLMNQSAPIQPNFSPGNNSKSNINYGPPRAIRTKRPNIDSGTNQSNSNENFNLAGSVDYSLTPPPPPPPKSDEDILNAIQSEELKLSQSEKETKTNDKESEILNLYGDVEEELDRNCNFNQQNINVRNSRPPPSDRYHLYNQSAAQNVNYRFSEPHSTQNRMNYQHSHYNNYRNQFPRGGGMYFPNRTTNFRPRHNYNMFN